VSARAGGITNNTVYIRANVDGTIFLICADNSTFTPTCAGSFIVPHKSTYSLTSNGVNYEWTELR